MMCACVRERQMCLCWGGVGVDSREYVSRLGSLSTEMYMRFKLHSPPHTSLHSLPFPSLLTTLSYGSLSQLSFSRINICFLFLPYFTYSFSRGQNGSGVYELSGGVNWVWVRRRQGDVLLYEGCPLNTRMKNMTFR